MADLHWLMGVLADAPVLESVGYDMKRRTLTLGVGPGAMPALATTLSRALPEAEVVVLAADDARDLLDELSRPEFAVEPGSTWLVKPGRVRVDGLFCLDDQAMGVCGDGYQATLYFQREPRVDSFGGVHRGGVWWGYESRLDALGRWWRREIKDPVTDDFGDLVSSATGGRP